MAFSGFSTILMAMNVKIGCASFGQYKRHDYFKRLGTVEYQQSFFDPPTDAVLTRLRRQAPEGFSFVVKAWQLVTHPPQGKKYPRLNRPLSGPAACHGSFQGTEQVQQAWQATRKAADLLGSSMILYETPASFTPTAANRKNMATFFQQDALQGLTHVWEPQGLWSPMEVHGVCEELGLVACWDPLATESMPPGPVAYLKIRNMGSPHPVSLSELDWLAQGLSEGYEAAHVVFNSSKMFADARKLAELLGT